jgi:hypothetical protein
VRSLVLGFPTAFIALALLPMAASAQAPRSIAVPRQIVEQIIADSAFLEAMPRNQRTLAATLRTEALDLDGDGTPELQVHGIKSMCGPNNCPTWIYRRASSGYERLLNAGAIQELEIQSKMSHGYHDIITAQHGGALDSELRRYTFDGHEYRLAGCFSRRYSYLDARGRFHELKRPRITAMACETSK